MNLHFKVIGQTALQNFQTEMAKAARDPYQVVMRKTGLPVTLLNEKAKHSRVHILDTQPFQDTFGKKASRQVTMKKSYNRICGLQLSFKNADLPKPNLLSLL